MSKSSVTPRKPIVLAPGQGRAYPMGRISAVFKADEEETQSRYSVSEWWLEPRTQGPGAHSHAEDDLFYVIEGVMRLRVGEKWFECPKGLSCSFLAESPMTSRTGEASVLES